MPCSEITKVTVSHFWDDQSSTDIDIAKSETETGTVVNIKEGSDIVTINYESWDNIRNQIDLFFGVGAND